MNRHEFDLPPEKIPQTQPAFSGGPPQRPPRPPKLTSNDLLDPGEPGRRIYVSDYIDVQGLAELLGVKPFKVVADLLALRIFKHADEFIDFSTAASIGNKHGFIVERFF